MVVSCSPQAVEHFFVPLPPVGAAAHYEGTDEDADEDGEDEEEEGEFSEEEEEDEGNGYFLEEEGYSEEEEGEGGEGDGHEAGSGQPGAQLLPPRVRAELQGPQVSASHLKCAAMLSMMLQRQGVH